MMMRHILSDADLLTWHRAALAGDDTARTEDPQCGWFKRRLVKGGPWIPARIWLYQPIEDGMLVGDAVMQCEVNGVYAEAEQQWTWICQNPIPEREFDYLTALISWTAEFAPDEPMANPQQAVDWSAVPIPTF
jgi:hypothetical protein